MEGFQTPRSSSESCSPRSSSLFRVLRSRKVLTVLQEDEHYYESDKSKSPSTCSDSDTSDEDDVDHDTDDTERTTRNENQISNETKRSDTQTSEEAGQKESTSRSDCQITTDSSVYEIEDFPETDMDTSPPVQSGNLLCDEILQPTLDGNLMEIEGSLIKEELDLEDYVYYSNEELEETILSNLEKGK